MLDKVDNVSATANRSTEQAYVTAPPQVFAPDQIGVIEEAGCTAATGPLRGK
jgi:hypothetical protein